MTLCRERTAVQQLMEVAKDTKSGGPAEGAHVHVVHLSDAEETLLLIKVYLLSHLWF
jgi:allantoinase